MKVAKIGVSDPGIGVVTAAVFIAGEIVGSGILAMPKAVVNAGIIGFPLIIIFCINSCFGGIKLGQCWEILEERYPEEYKGVCRNPYTEIGERAMGAFGKNIVTLCNYFTLFGVSTVYILLSSQMVEELLKNYLPTISFCVWILVLALVLTPLMWFGSPKDFWLVGVFALSTTLISCILILWQMIIDYNETKRTVIHQQHGWVDIFTSSGAIMFSFGGASIFPTIQNDMKNRGMFKFSVLIAFTVILGIYMPITILSYILYGEETEENVILSLSKSTLVTISNLLMALHTIMAFLITINPVSLQNEILFNIPNELGVKRCISRTGIILLIIIVGETIPHFGNILSLIGASTTALTTFVFPNVFYMFLCNQETKDSPKRIIPMPVKLYMWLLIGIGIFGGIAATYSSIVSMFDSETFTKPCYWPK